MTNVPANLLLVKYRQQFGLRPFIQIALLDMRFRRCCTCSCTASGRLSWSGQSRSYGEWPDHADGALFPARHAARQAPGGAMIGLCIPQLATPLARVLSP